MKRYLTLTPILLLVACAVTPYDPALPHTNQARYQTDLKACQAHSEHHEGGYYLSSMGGPLGQLIYAGITQDENDNPFTTKETVITHCMQMKGYKNPNQAGAN
jgi:hypothetical protein